MLSNLLSLCRKLSSIYLIKERGKYSYKTYIRYHRSKDYVSSVLIVNWQLRAEMPRVIKLQQARINCNQCK